MYGMTTAGKDWGDDHYEWMLSVGFIQSSVNGALLWRINPDGTVVRVLNYIDDELYYVTTLEAIAGKLGNETMEKQLAREAKCKVAEEAFAKEVAGWFHINILSNTHWFLSIWIIQDEHRNVMLDQSQYCKAIVKRYLGNSMHQGKVIDRPLPNSFEASKADGPSSKAESDTLLERYGISYPSCIGALIYLTATQLELDFTVHKLARFMSGPGDCHYWALVHALKYLRCNAHYGIKYYHHMVDAPVTNLLRQAELNCDSSLLYFSDSS